MQEKKDEVFKIGTEEDRTIARSVYEEVFRDPPSYTNFYFQHLFDPKRFLMMYEGDQLSASLHENPHHFYLDDELFPTLFLFAVAVAREYRRKGYMDRLLRHSLHTARASGYSSIFLTPIYSKLYRNYGFSYVSNLEHYRISLDRLHVSDEWNLKKLREEIQIVSFKELSSDKLIRNLVFVYQKKMKRNCLYFERKDQWYRQRLIEMNAGGERGYLLYRGKDPTGYVMIISEENTLRITEMLLTEPDQAALIFSMLETEKEYYQILEICAPEKSEINFFTENQGDMAKEVRPVFMARILNPIVLLNNRIRKMEKYQPTVGILDDLFPENTGTYQIDGRGSYQKLAKSGGNFSACDLAVRIEDLASLIFGFWSFEDLLSFGKIKHYEEKKYRELLEFFPERRNYIREYL
jgi:predicted acetyltransferase